MLEVRDLTKRFGGLLAVDRASLSVSEGSIVALIGPNGAGKTTLFAAIAGFYRPDSGAVSFRGAEITGLPPHRICRLGMVRTFQITQPFARLSVLENIMTGAYLRTSVRSEAEARAREVARQVGLEARLDMPGGDLTVAGRKRLEVARALATAPRLLLLDEVMAGLNPSELADFVDVIRDLPNNGVTVLLIEHVMQAVMRLAEHVYVLNNGQVIAAGTPSAIAADPHVVEAYLGAGAASRMLEQAPGA